MINKLFYFYYSSDKDFKVLNSDQKKLFIENRIKSNKIALSICFLISFFIVVIPYLIH